MANRYVRIYDGPSGDTSVLGASLSATRAIDSPLVHETLADAGHAVEELERPVSAEFPGSPGYEQRVPEDGVSYSYLEIRPPIDDETVQKLGRLFVQHDIVDPYHNSAFLVDSRDGKQDIVASW